MKLNLGCNTDIKDGYINIDLYKYNDSVVIDDITNISFAKIGEVGEIYAKDILEHLPYKIAISSLDYWCKLLKSSGKIFLQTTCLPSMIKCYNEKIWDIETLNYMLFAGVAYNKEVSDSDYHKSIFDSDILLNVFKDNNIAIINLELDPVDDLVIDPKSHNLNIKILGIKQ